MESATAIEAEMAAAMAEHEEGTKTVDAIFDAMWLNRARRVMRAIRYRPSCEMAVRAILAEDIPPYSARVLRRFLKLSRAKRRASGVTIGGGRLRVSRWGE